MLMAREDSSGPVHSLLCLTLQFLPFLPCSFLWLTSGYRQDPCRQRREDRRKAQKRTHHLEWRWGTPAVLYCPHCAMLYLTVLCYAVLWQLHVDCRFPQQMPCRLVAVPEQLLCQSSTQVARLNAVLTACMHASPPAYAPACLPAANPTKEMRLQWQQEAKEK
jgi:hypothetical protein